MPSSLPKTKCQRTQEVTRTTIVAKKIVTMRHFDREQCQMSHLRERPRHRQMHPGNGRRIGAISANQCGRHHRDKNNHSSQSDNSRIQRRSTYCNCWKPAKNTKRLTTPTTTQRTQTPIPITSLPLVRAQSHLSEFWFQESKQLLPPLQIPKKKSIPKIFYSSVDFMTTWSAELIVLIYHIFLDLGQTQE